MSPFARRLQQGIHNYTGGTVAITHGRQLNATNTGIAKAGLVEANLTPLAGGTFSTNGATYTNRIIDGTVTVTGSNIKFAGCTIRNDGASAMMVVAAFSCVNLTLENCTIYPVTGSAYDGVVVQGGASGANIIGCNISKCENGISINDDCSNVLVDMTYVHDTSNASNPSGHKDAIEVYGGANTIIRRSRVENTHYDETSAINIAPWSGAASADGVLVEDCYIDGGHMHFVIDLQSTGFIRNVQVLRNDMGGHTTPTVGGYYWSFNGSGAGFTSSPAAQISNPALTLCPTNGADVNYWVNCSDINAIDATVPDLSGTVLDPSMAAYYRP